MDKELKITLFFLGIIFSLYIAIYYYLDIGRYCKLRKCRSLEQLKPYIESYSKLETIKDEEVVVSIALNDDNEKLSTYLPMIASILDQNIRCHIVLALPNGKSVYDIDPIFMEFMSITDNINDYGYYTNLIPIVRSKIETDKKIICINDKNVVYGKDFLQMMINTSNKYPSSIISTNTQDPCFAVAVLVKSNFLDLNNFVDDCSWFMKAIVPPTDIKKMKYTENYVYA